MAEHPYTHGFSVSPASAAIRADCRLTLIRTWAAPEEARPALEQATGLPFPAQINAVEGDDPLVFSVSPQEWFIADFSAPERKPALEAGLVLDVTDAYYLYELDPSAAADLRGRLFTTEPSSGPYAFATRFRELRLIFIRLKTCAEFILLNRSYAFYFNAWLEEFARQALKHNE